MLKKLKLLASTTTLFAFCVAPQALAEPRSEGQHRRDHYERYDHRDRDWDRHERHRDHDRHDKRRRDGWHDHDRRHKQRHGQYRYGDEAYYRLWRQADGRYDYWHGRRHDWLRSPHRSRTHARNSRHHYSFSFGLGHSYYSKPRYRVGGHYYNSPHTVIISDYRHYGLRRPPRGYHWVHDHGSDDAILASVATGAIIGLMVGILAN